MSDVNVELQLLDTDAAISRVLAPAEQLIAAAYPRPTMEMNALLLAWHLTGVAFDSVRPMAAAAFVGDRLVGFAGATPRRFTLDGTCGVGHVVSFVAVAPDLQGRGVGGRLYDQLLSAAPPDARVLTFAVEGSAGMIAIERAYPRNGFVAKSLGVIPPYAVFRSRTQTSSGRVDADVERESVLAMAHGVEVARHLDKDPRGSVQVAEFGARAIAARRLTEDGSEPLLLLEDVDASVRSDDLREIVSAAFDAFPDHGKMLVVPNLPAPVASVARSVGLRRLSGPDYRVWICCRDPDDMFLTAQSTSHPVV
ncbi:MAG TPA: GNAT family N-acetyltransferase [Gemmatimonadaceae bacterium]|nr:GNAT family N-acetyltransferase [Gemmatimonadaceae bacterium]